MAVTSPSVIACVASPYAAQAEVRPLLAALPDVNRLTADTVVRRTGKVTLLRVPIQLDGQARVVYVKLSRYSRRRWLTLWKAFIRPMPAWRGWASACRRLDHQPAERIRSPHSHATLTSFSLPSSGRLPAPTGEDAVDGGVEDVIRVSASARSFGSGTGVSVRMASVT